METKECNLGIPIYLNQKVVFDLMATMNNGLAQITHVSSNKGNGTIVGGDAELGNSNIFALLGVRITGSHTDKKEEMFSEERIHTPSSLFNMMRKKLIDEKQVFSIDSVDCLKKINSGCFVEFEGTITKNPIIDTLRNVKNMIELASAFTDQKNKKKNKEKDANQSTINQIKTLVSIMETNGMVDVICSSASDPSFKAIMPVYSDFFFNKNMNEIVDGQFKVFGKVTKVCLDDNSINLMRNTSLTLIKQDMLEELFQGLKSVEGQGVKMPELPVSIEAPSMIVLPIAIYI